MLDEYIQRIKEESVCNKRKVGCVVYDKKGKIISYGKNHGYFEQCTCSLTEKNPHCLHAETMALAGTDDLYKGAILETTYAPCLNCSVLIVQKGISEVIYHEADKCMTGVKYLIDHKVKVRCKN